MSQPNFVAEQFTGLPGRYVELPDTIAASARSWTASTTTCRSRRSSWSDDRRGRGEGKKIHAAASDPWRAERIHLEIVTRSGGCSPGMSRIVLRGDGSFGVLPGHHPMLAPSARRRVLSRRRRTDVLAISWVSPSRTGPGFGARETAEKAEEIDTDRARRKTRRTQVDLA